MTTDAFPSLTHYLDEALRLDENEEEPRAYLGISQLGRCGRASGYALMPNDYPRVVETESLRFWHEGNVAEEDAVFRLIRGGCPVFNRQVEVTFPEGHPLAGRVFGHIDGEVPLQPALALSTDSLDGIDMAVLEVKSLRQGALKKLAECRQRNPEYPVAEAWPQYAIQAHTYAYCRHRRWIAYLIKDRNSGEIVEAWESLDVKWVQLAVAQGLQVLEALDRGELPGRDYDPAKDWQCRKEYCQWRQLCLEAGA